MISPQSSGLPKLVPSPLSAAGQYDGRQISLSVHPLEQSKYVEQVTLRTLNKYHLFFIILCCWLVLIVKCLYWIQKKALNRGTILCSV